MTQDIEQMVADRTDAVLRVHNLKQAHERLADIRTRLKGTRGLLTDESLTDRIDWLIDNGIEPLMWEVEQTVRKAGPA